MDRPNGGLCRGARGSYIFLMSAPTNRKAATPKESPQEPFKRAVAGTMRAMAKTPKLDVSFAPERPSLIVGEDGAKARLPEPARKITQKEAAITRGCADSLALRLACHNEAAHRRLSPTSMEARAAFDAIEQARVELIGSRRMSGVAANIAAMLDDRYQRGKFDAIERRRGRPARRRARADRAPTADRPAAAAAREKNCRSLAGIYRRAGQRRSRSAKRRDRGSTGLRADRAPFARQPRYVRARTK